MLHFYRQTATNATLYNRECATVLSIQSAKNQLIRLRTLGEEASGATALTQKIGTFPKVSNLSMYSGGCSVVMPWWVVGEGNVMNV